MDIVNTKIGMGLFAILASLALGGCGGSDDPQSGQAIYDTKVTIPPATKDADTGATINSYLTYELGDGTYWAEITATNGISIQWNPSSDAACAEQADIVTYSRTCTLNIKGQLVLVNPHLLSEVTVTLKVVKH